MSSSHLADATDLPPHVPLATDDHDSEDEDRSSILKRQGDDGADIIITEEEEQTEALLGAEGRTRGNERISRHKKVIMASNARFVVDILKETAPALFFSVTGLLLTGQLLEGITEWKAFRTINELFILVPMVNNLKGNLEMNLSARLSTAANIGQLDSRSVRYSLLLGNLSLLQVQAASVSALAAILSFILGRILPPATPVPPPPSQNITDAAGAVTAMAANVGTFVLREFIGEHRAPVFTDYFAHVTRGAPTRIHHPGLPPSGPMEFMIVLSTAMSSACLSSLILGSFMCSLVVLCRKMKLNPDNIAPPVASTLGDLLTLSLLGITSSYLLNMKLPLLIVVLCTLLGFIIFSFVITVKNPYVSKLLWTGWTPLLAAMVISSGTGMVLDQFVGQYEDYAILAITIGGLPGSVGSILISRLSTSLHAWANSYHSEDPSPSKSFTKLAPPDSRPLLAGVTLFIATIPVMIAFMAFVYATGWLTLPKVFTIVFSFFFCAAVLFSLVIGTYITLFLWSRNLDPDTYALPVQSSMVDLVGQALLVMCFEFVSRVLGADVANKRRKRKAVKGS